MMNYIFGLFIIVGIIYSFITGNTAYINESLITSGESAISMIMKIASTCGLLTLMSKKLSKIIHPLFPELPKDSEAISYIATNIAMNMLGTGSGATPFGLKAFECMQKDNPKKDTATRSMITFLVINTASVTLIPTTVISLRTLNKSVNPTEIITASIIVTILSCAFGIIMDRIFYYLWRKDD